MSRLEGEALRMPSVKKTLTYSFILFSGIGHPVSFIIFPINLKTDELRRINQVLLRYFLPRQIMRVGL